VWYFWVNINHSIFKDKTLIHFFFLSYCNFLCEKSRREICDNLLNGLSRLEYRGYDSAGKFLNIYTSGSQIGKTSFAD
jgi:hypothetical protein